MTVRVLFFSTLRSLTGQDALERVYPDPLTVADVLKDLYTVHPELQTWDEQLLIAVDLAYASRETLLKDGQELALMPPVQGG